MTCRSGFSALELLPHLGLAVGGRLKDRQLGRQRRLLQRIGLLAGLLRRDIDADHVLAALEQRFQHGLAEGLLAMDHDAHGSTPRAWALMGPWRFAGRAGCLDLGDLARRELQHLGQDLVGVLAQQRRALHLGDAVGELDRVADRQVLAARRVIDLDDGAGVRAATAPRPVPSSTGSGRTGMSNGVADRS